jgi:glycosyltransferase involved in cell wall biosynthesis
MVAFFFSQAKKNFLIVQSPVHLPQTSWKTELKLRNWNLLCYSKFMQDIIKTKINKSAIQLPPAIDTVHFGSRALTKEKIILSVGRFFPAPHNKKHDVLIETFKRYYLQYFKGYKLIIAGGLSEDGGRAVLNQLNNLIENAPIEILIDVPFAQLTNLFAKAKFYWHAAGYGEDLQLHPERAEHFGITPLEAMSSETIPLAYNAGGPADIIQDDRNGFLWDIPEELAEKTAKLISDTKKLHLFQDAAKKRSHDFSEEMFNKRLDALLVM